MAEYLTKYTNNATPLVDDFTVTPNRRFTHQVRKGDIYLLCLANQI